MSILLLLFFVSINGLFAVPMSKAVSDNKSLRLNMVTRYSRALSVNENIYNGNKRRKAAQVRVAEMTLKAGDYLGIETYLVHFQVGTPPQTFMLVPDTGSELTWVSCQYQCHDCKRRSRGGRALVTSGGGLHGGGRGRGGGGHHHGGGGGHHSGGGGGGGGRGGVGGRGGGGHHHGRVRVHHRLFQADQSSSFKTIPCSSETCKDLSYSLVDCPTRMSPCNYDYAYYAHQLDTQGLYANETVTVDLVNGGKVSIDQVPIGCSKSYKGDVLDVVDGVLALGFSNQSFAFNAMNVFGGKFAYCLVNHLSPVTASSYIVFGSHDYPEIPKMQETDLVLGVIDIFYAVNVVGISVGNQMLDIPSRIWDVNDGGMVINSGTSLTMLTKEAYDKVMNALKAPLMRLKRKQVKPFEFCFDTKGYRESMVPKLTFHFSNKAKFEPLVKSYVIVVDKWVRCLGFVPAGHDEVSVMGNIMQQNYLWEFDLIRQKLRFGPSSCV